MKLEFNRQLSGIAEFLGYCDVTVSLVVCGHCLKTSSTCCVPPWGCCVPQGKTVAMLAAGAGRDSVLRALTMKRGPSLFNLAAADGGTPAMSAAVHGETGALKEILEVSDLNAQDEDGWTALMFAACAGHPSSVAALLDAGADASIKNKDGATAHDLAQERGYDDVIRALVEPKDARA